MVIVLGRSEEVLGVIRTCRSRHLEGVLDVLSDSEDGGSGTLFKKELDASDFPGGDGSYAQSLLDLTGPRSPGVVVLGVSSCSRLS